MVIGKFEKLQTAFIQTGLSSSTGILQMATSRKKNDSPFPDSSQLSKLVEIFHLCYNFG